MIRTVCVLACFSALVGAAPKPWIDLGDEGQSGFMMDLTTTGTDPDAIDFSALPRLPGDHAVITTETPDRQFRLHEYLARYEGR